MFDLICMQLNSSHCRSSHTRTRFLNEAENENHNYSFIFHVSTIKFLINRSNDEAKKCKQMWNSIFYFFNHLYRVCLKQIDILDSSVLEIFIFEYQVQFLAIFLSFSIYKIQYIIEIEHERKKQFESSSYLMFLHKFNLDDFLKKSNNENRSFRM
jgi:hypothetical protein